MTAATPLFKPLILVSTDLFGEPVREGIRRQYLDAVVRAGGVPLQLPLGIAPEDCEALVAMADGVLFTGGADIDPRHYGEEVSPYCGKIYPERDAVEFAVVKAALRQKRAIFAICRGMQVLNVALGGTLIQDLPETMGLPLTAHRQESDYSETAHDVVIRPGTKLASIAGTEVLAVNTKHHQAVKTPGEGLIVTAESTDGVVEGLELPGGAFVVGVQWHPEMLETSHPRHAALFAAFVTAARRKQS